MEEAIEILNSMKVKDYFENKKVNKVIYLRMQKSDLIDFCIKLLKLIIEVEEEDANKERN